MVSGTFDVFVDIVDPKLNRTVYRVFGPPSEVVASKEQKSAPAQSDGASAYSKQGGAAGDPQSQVKYR